MGKLVFICLFVGIGAFGSEVSRPETKVEVKPGKRVCAVKGEDCTRYYYGGALAKFQFCCDGLSCREDEPTTDPKERVFHCK